RPAGRAGPGNAASGPGGGTRWASVGTTPGAGRRLDRGGGVRSVAAGARRGRHPRRDHGGRGGGGAGERVVREFPGRMGGRARAGAAASLGLDDLDRGLELASSREIGRASCREREAVWEGVRG